MEGTYLKIFVYLKFRFNQVLCIFIWQAYLGMKNLSGLYQKKD